jgi:uncharacterized protein
VDLSVWVTPRAARSEVTGVTDGWLRVRLAAAPHEGRANAALVSFVAGLLGVPPSVVRLARGATSRRKVLRVSGVTPGEARRLLGI